MLVVVWLDLSSFMSSRFYFHVRVKTMISSSLFCKGLMYYCIYSRLSLSLSLSPGIKHEFHVIWGSYRSLAVTKRVTLLEFTLPENLSSPTVFSGVRNAHFIRCVDHCLSFRLVVIVLAVLVQFTSSDYPFDIVKLFLLMKP